MYFQETFSNKLSTILYFLIIFNHYFYHFRRSFGRKNVKYFYILSREDIAVFFYFSFHLYLILFSLEKYAWNLVRQKHYLKLKNNFEKKTLFSDNHEICHFLRLCLQTYKYRLLREYRNIYYNFTMY